jgi:hypothetical protein
VSVLVAAFATPTTLLLHHLDRGAVVKLLRECFFATQDFGVSVRHTAKTEANTNNRATQKIKMIPN